MPEEPKSNPSSQSKEDEAGATRAWAERWLSQKRLAPYLAACGGNVEQALDLYEWNISLGQVLMRDVAHFEVALRNAYDRVLRENWDGAGHWLLDDASPVRAPIMRTSRPKKVLDVNVANRKAISQAQGRSHDRNDPDQVISNLMMGFWAHLTDRSRERDL